MRREVGTMEVQGCLILVFLVKHDRVLVSFSVHGMWDGGEAARLRFTDRRHDTLQQLDDLVEHAFFHMESCDEGIP